MPTPRVPAPDATTVPVHRIVLDREHYDLLSQLAAENERTLHQQLRYAIRQWVDGQQRPPSPQPRG